jgi:hypothetical protein
MGATEEVKSSRGLRDATHLRTNYVCNALLSDTWDWTAGSHVPHIKKKGRMDL